MTTDPADVETVPRVCVALPVHRDAATLEAAAGCVLRQTLDDIEIVIVPNGADGPALDAVTRVACLDARIKVEQLEQGNLAKAMNHVLRRTACPLVARMDADDLCEPQRLAVQVQAMAGRPHLAALGSDFALTDSTGATVAIRRPPRDERESRWRLCLGNPFAHGSMLLRRDAVLAVGGYDESLPRAQDHDLWLRLSSMGVAAVPEVLYTHRLRDLDQFSASPLQAQCAAAVLAGAWSSLPVGDVATVRDPLSLAMAGESDAARSRVESLLTQSGPTHAGLTALLWIDSVLPPMARRATNICRAARVREVASQLCADGVGEIWLYGAGPHTAAVLDVFAGQGLRIAGIIDDAAAGVHRFGRVIVAPAEVPDDAVVLLSSDASEDRLWSASEPMRRRGVRVKRLYA
ncbi:MAG: glycosyltransferase [Planctomycetes bacterium]|nr:glycosyltransferase [Planctomycetota bacterium]